MFRQTDESRIQICKVCTREAGPSLRIHPPRRTCRICPSASPRVDVFNLLSRAAAHVNLDIYSLTACKLREKRISSSVSASPACPKFRLLREKEEEGGKKEKGRREEEKERERSLCTVFFLRQGQTRVSRKNFCIEYSYTRLLVYLISLFGIYIFFFLIILISNDFLIKKRKIIFTK